MKPEPIKVSAGLEKATTMKDGSVRLTFDTQELDARRAGDLFALKNQVGWLIFATYGTDEVVIPEAPPPEFRTDKSPSQRLRACLYVLFEQLGRPGEFEDFYKRQMEVFIKQIKDKL